MPRRLLTEKQLAFIEEGTDAVESHNIANYESRVRANLNRGVPQILAHFPELVAYLDADRIQQEVDGADIGYALGQLLTAEQRRRLAATLVWGEQRPDESDQEFLDRVPELLDEFKTDLEPLAHQVETASEQLEFLREVADSIHDQFEKAIAQRRETEAIEMAVPVERVLAGVQTEPPDTEQPSVADLLTELYGGWDDGVEATFLACREILISLGMQQNVESVRPGGSETAAAQWGIGRAPTPTDREQYLAVIDALETEIQELVARYFEVEQIAQKDQLLRAALDVLEEVSQPERELLEWDELKRVRPKWTGQHTRVAKRWSDNRPLTLLRETSESEAQQTWEWTAFGAFVRAIQATDIEHGAIEETEFPRDIPNGIVEDAVAELTGMDDAGE